MVTCINIAIKDRTVALHSFIQGYSLEFQLLCVSSVLPVCMVVNIQKYLPIVSTCEYVFPGDLGVSAGDRRCLLVVWVFFGDLECLVTGGVH